eukprot:2372451-Pleurochrysis_carterae.AAC.3
MLLTPTGSQPHPSSVLGVGTPDHRWLRHTADRLYALAIIAEFELLRPLSLLGPRTQIEQFPPLA